MKTPILRIQKFSGSIARFPKGRAKISRAYYFRIVAANGEIVCASEAYTTARARNKTVALLVAAKMEEGK